MSARDVLVGDVGGTNARLARATIDGASVTLHEVARKSVAVFRSLEAALEDWTREHGAPPSEAVFALAGPTGADEVRFTNSDWVVSASSMKRRFGFEAVTLVNDFAAQARAVPLLEPDAFETLIDGAGEPGAPIVVLGPGTGLGLALLIPIGDDWRVIPAEAGHQAFAPVGARERAILAAVAETRGNGHVSFEDLVSGLGLDRLYRAIATLDGRPARLSGGHEIGPAAISGDDPVAVEAATTLTLALATFAGDAVLTTGARGGCVIAGGVAEALAPFLRTEAFRARYRDKGPVSAYFDGLPLRRVRDGFAALKGAACFARPSPNTTTSET